jgi:hypothetical protein
MKRALILLAGIVLSAGNASPCRAGEVSWFSEMSYLHLTEKVDGSTVLTEEGAVTRNGISYYGGLVGNLSVKLSGSADVGVMAYDGFSIDDLSKRSSVTSHLGTSEEIRPSLDFKVGERVTLIPQFLVGHRWFFRTASNEYWNILYLKGGSAFEYAGDDYRFSVAGGVKLPFYTTIHLDWRDSGYETPFTLKPKGELTGYAEVSAGKRDERWRLALTFEESSWKASDRIPLTRKLSASSSGAIIQNCKAFQPDTEMLTVGIKFVYLF